MNKKNKILIIIMVIFLIGFVFEKINTNKSDVYEEQNVSSIKKNNELLSMNLEQTAGAGDYKTVTQSGWPTEGYKFNEELSRCENGSALSWDDTKKTVIMQGNVSDKCYVYFDIIPQITLAEYVISQYTGIQGENGIYYHNSSLENGAGDNSYRYAGGDYVLTDAGKATGATEILAYNDNAISLIEFYCDDTKHYFGYTCGSSNTFYYLIKGDNTHYKTYQEVLSASLSKGYVTGDLIKNYVCFDTSESPCPTDNLYRIIGIMDGKVKLIKYDYATKDMLLSNGLYEKDVVASTYGYSSFYKGALSNISLYYAGSETALAYNLNETKKVQKLSRKNELAVGDPCSGEKIKLNETALGVINLNTNYYGLLSNDSKNKITNSDWFINSVSVNNLTSSYTIYTSEYNNSEKTTIYSAYIGLMYLSDYGYANISSLWAVETNKNDYREAINNNWMYMGVQEGVITYYDTCNPYAIDSDGAINSIGYSWSIAIRPTFYLKSDVSYKSGVGTISSPIILEN